MRKIRIFEILAIFIFSAISHVHAGEDYGFLLAHTMKNDYGKLYYSLSEDGYNYALANNGNPVNKNYYGHPDICKGKDGNYFMIGISDSRQSAIIWASEDLAKWTHYGEIDKRLFDSATGYQPDPRDLGAPKMFYDAEKETYIITWHASSQVRQAARKQDRAYWQGMRTLYTQSADLKTFSPARPLFQWNIPTIDTILKRDAHYYYAFFKDEREPSPLIPEGKTIRMAKAYSAAGPFGDPSEPLTSNYREAPSVSPGKTVAGYVIVYEKYPAIGYEMALSESLAGPWYSPHESTYEFSPGIRHASLLRLEKKDFVALRKALSDNASTEKP